MKLNFTIILQALFVLCTLSGCVDSNSNESNISLEESSDSISESSITDSFMVPDEQIKFMELLQQYQAYKEQQKRQSYENNVLKWEAEEKFDKDLYEWFMNSFYNLLPDGRFNNWYPSEQVHL